jgi:hypothetical protein
VVDAKVVACPHCDFEWLQDIPEVVDGSLVEVVEKGPDLPRQGSFWKSPRAVRTTLRQAARNGGLVSWEDL